MKGVIMDFGGTLDTNGIHWCEKFYSAYSETGIPIDKKVFDRVYLKAEPQVGNYINKTSSFTDVLRHQITLQYDYLATELRLFSFLKKSAVTGKVIESCYADVMKEMEKTKGTLEHLGSRYQLGIVSNYYGNLETVLKELDIFGYFSFIADSKCVGIKKPDPGIYKKVLSGMGLKAKESVMTGDSYSADIIPAKSIGMNTIWLKGKSWENPQDMSKADRIIYSLEELREIL